MGGRYRRRDGTGECEVLIVNARSVIFAWADTGQRASLSRESFEVRWERA